MRVYFLAEKTSALTVGGAYLGIVDGFERSVELDPADGLFCEIKPSGDLPVRFCFDGDFLLSPPPQITLYYSETAVAVYCSGFLRADQSLKVLWQERLGGTLLTLYLQGKLQLNVENETGFHILSLPDSLQTATVKSCGENFLLEGTAAFALVTKEGAISVLSEGKVLEAEKTLKAEVPFHDSMGHTAVCEWRDGALVSCAIRSSREPTEATFALALFESALIGADCTPYLAPALAEKADSLKEFLGDFRSVVLTGERDVVGLTYERREHVFDVRRYRVEITDGKISNILPI